jgi:hypothetical protein
MKLGKLIEALEQVQDKSLPVSILPFDLSPTGFDSYRGYYNQLAICYSTEKHEPTVEEFLNMARACVGNTFTGYKGGTYLMGEDTPVWISNYGRCSYRLLSKVKVTGFCVYLKTEKSE